MRFAPGIPSVGPVPDYEQSYHLLVQEGLGDSSKLATNCGLNPGELVGESSLNHRDLLIHAGEIPDPDQPHIRPFADMALQKTPLTVIMSYCILMS